MNGSKWTFLLLIIFVSSIVVSCDFPAQSSMSDIEQASTQTLEALDRMVSATLEAVPGVESDTAEATAEPAPQEEPPEEASPTPEITHLTQPENPGSISSYMTDQSTRPLAAERRAIADNFNQNIIERPYTSEVMDYLEYLDITRAELSMSAPWIYVTIFLEGEPPVDSTAIYAVEIDIDIDGRGDWYVSGVVPPSSEWTTVGVFAWSDTNNDVGGIVPLQADSPNPAWDGYDDMVFDQGFGPDPDVAWIRRSPTHPDRVQLAFKQTLIGSIGKFMWGAWAEELVMQPGWMDYNDHFLPEEAGSPEITSSLYPLKQAARMDNTCRWAVGFTPDGTEPGVCYVPPPTPVPTLTSTPRPSPTPTQTPIPPPA